MLYHLRHPLLALDNLYRLAGPNSMVLLETEVSDAKLSAVAGQSVVAFYPNDELMQLTAV